MVSTADAVAANTGALNLAALRGLAEPGLEELLDACQSTYVKGDVRTHGGTIADLTREVLVGRVLGRVVEAAGRPPLLRSFYAAAKANRLDLSGESKVVRCDPSKQSKHRDKSAFLHACDYLDVPLFTVLEGSRFAADSVGHYRGADLIAGTEMHLVAETWGVKWQETVDDRLIELSDRGATLQSVAASLLGEALLEARMDAAASVRMLLQCAQMRLTDSIDEALRVVELAVAEDQSFDHLVQALSDLSLIHGYRDALDTQGDRRVAMALRDVYQRACLRLPAIRSVPEEQEAGAVDRLHTLVRVAGSFDAVALDTSLLIENLGEMVRDPKGSATLRGAGYGLLFGFGAVRENGVARELEGYLRGSPRQIRLGAEFMDGLFGSARSIVLGRDSRLLDVITTALARLEWHDFKQLLPHLRRAFTRFIPTELDAIASRVAKAQDSVPAAGPLSAALRAHIQAADQRVIAR
jgi:hypothetical protein